MSDCMYLFRMSLEFLIKYTGRDEGKQIVCQLPIKCFLYPCRCHQMTVQVSETINIEKVVLVNDTVNGCSSELRSSWFAK